MEQGPEPPPASPPTAGEAPDHAAEAAAHDRERLPDGAAAGGVEPVRSPHPPHLPPTPPFVSVAIRVRPSLADESVAVWAQPTEGPEVQRRVCVHRGYVLEEYEFSRVFGPEDDNRRLFHDLQGPRLAQSVFCGVNETLFAYGQTGSGKTHTIFGVREEPGLLQLFVRALFDRAAMSPGSTVHACCYEILGDSLTDLVDAEAFVNRGDLRPEDVVCDELFIKTQKCRYQIVRVSCLETCLALLQDARINRSAGVSSCNTHSSRTHAVVHLFVQNPVSNTSSDGASEASADGLSSTIGALTLVDLAGTEKEHENPSEQGRKSTRLLNTSLSSLNRLLRKLQTGCLDESERRQSVLNKCLWEYMRPGCGIALIFCVSPLLKHRAVTLSTLGMATESKLIHNQRKAQYIQLPAPPREAQGDAQGGSSPRSSARRAAGPGAGVAGGPGWSSATPAASPAMEERTPVGRGAGTPRRSGAASSGHGGDNLGPQAGARGGRPRSSPAIGGRSGHGGGGDLCLTPRSVGSVGGGFADASPVRPRMRQLGGAAGVGGRPPSGGARSLGGTAAPWAAPQPWQTRRGGGGAAAPGDCDDPLSDAGRPLERGCDLGGAGSDLHLLEIQNSRLRRKLTRTRVRSQERVSRAERRMDQVGAEKIVLQRECESLRALFIRQQQQQIAFWTGPFMEMLASKDQGGALKKGILRGLRSGEVAQSMMRGSDPRAAAAAAAAAATAAAQAAAVAKSGGGPIPQVPGWSVALSGQLSACGAEEADDPSDLDPASRAECLKALKRERDYWRTMATELKREMHSGDPRSGASGVDALGGSLRESDDLSTSRGRDLEGSSEGTAGGGGYGMCSSSSSSASCCGTPSGPAPAFGSGGSAWPPYDAAPAGGAVGGAFAGLMAPVAPPLPPGAGAEALDRSRRRRPPGPSAHTASLAHAAHRRTGQGVGHSGEVRTYAQR